MSAPLVTAPRGLDPALPGGRVRRPDSGLAAAGGCAAPTATGWPHPVGIRDGLIAAVAAAAAPSWADLVLANDVTGTLVWGAGHGQAELHAMRSVRRPGVQALSLAPAGSDPGPVRVALQLSKQLGALRAGAGAADPACVTSPSQPATPADLVRIPHLVTVRADTRQLTDRPTGACMDAVVWELTTRAAAVRWLGGPLPDQNLVEAHLPRLLALRTAARAGHLPPTRHGARLAALLHGRPLPLSIRLVYRHLEVFRDLFTDTAGAPA